MMRDQTLQGRAHAVLASIDYVALVEADGQVVEREGARHRICCPFHGETTPSLYLFPDGLHCFGCGWHGDAITWVRQRRGLSFLAALEALEGAGPKLPEPRPAKRGEAVRKHLPVMPVPAKAPAIRYHHRRLGEPVAVWEYRTGRGDLLMADARYEYPHPQRPDETKKEVLTWCWATNTEDGSQGWACTRPANLLPLYGQVELAAKPDALVVVCEGAKKAQRISRDTPHVGVSWCGGNQVARRADGVDWLPLAGRRVVLWPDWDAVGIQAMQAVAASLWAQVVGVVDLRGANVPESYDAADAIDQVELHQRLANLAPVDHLPAMLASLDAPAEPVGEPSDDHDGDGPPDDDGPDGGESGAQPPEESKELRADLANADRFVRDHRNQLRSCPERAKGRSGDQCWYVWTGTHWQQDRDGAAQRLAVLTIRAIASEYLAAADDLARLAQAKRDEAAAAKAQAATAEGNQKYDLQKVYAELRDEATAIEKRIPAERRKAETIQMERRILSILSLASKDSRLVISPADLDQHPHLVNTPNGTIDLRTGQLGKHRRDQYLTTITAAEYDPAATSEQLARVLTDVCNGDQAVVQFVQQAIGASLIGDNRHEKVFIWFGPGGSGKGTLLEAVKSAFGPYCMTAEATSFVEGAGKAIRDDLHRLQGARMVLAAEVNQGSRFDTAVLKMFSGGDTITSRALYGDLTEAVSICTLHLQTNHLPHADANDSGVWRRLIVIPTGPTIPDHLRDPSLKAHLRDPKTGGKAVLAWAVAGAIAAFKQKHLAEPAAVRLATAAYRISQDQVADFVVDNCRIADPVIEPRLPHKAGQRRPDGRRTFVKSTTLYKRFSDWIIANGQKPWGKKRFNESMERYFHQHKAKEDNTITEHWYGLTLANGFDYETSSFYPDDDEHTAAAEARNLRVCGFAPSQEVPIRAHDHSSLTRADFPDHSKSANPQKEGQDETWLDLGATP